MSNPTEQKGEFLSNKKDSNFKKRFLESKKYDEFKVEATFPKMH